MTLKVRRYECTACGSTKEELKWNYETPPDCHGAMVETSRVARFGQASNVIGDDIPGGLLIEHGICNADGTPRRFYSKKEIRDTARKQGWTRDGDTPKSRHDRWV